MYLVQYTQLKKQNVGSLILPVVLSMSWTFLLWITTNSSLFSLGFYGEFFSKALCWDWQFLATFCASDKPGFSMDIIINIKISKWLINATGQWYLEHSFMTDCLVPSISLNWEYKSRFSLTDLHSQECQSLNKILKKILKKKAY